MSDNKIHSIKGGKKGDPSSREGVVTFYGMIQHTSGEAETVLFKGEHMIGGAYRTRDGYWFYNPLTKLAEPQAHNSLGDLIVDIMAAFRLGLLSDEVILEGSFHDDDGGNQSA